LVKTDLHSPPIMPDLLIEGLNRYDERPCLFLGENTATYKDVREATSKMVQALLEQNLGVGSRVAVLSANRPEVLYNIAAMQLSGCAGSPLHPLGSMDDHAYAMEAAEIDALVYDPIVFDDHAAALKDRIPNLKLLSFGPSKFGLDYLELSENFSPGPLSAPDVNPDDISSITFTGGTTGKPKCVMSTYRATAYMSQIQIAEWEFPSELRMLIATPLSHAAAAFFVPVLQQGGAFYVMQGFTPDTFFDMVKKHQITATMLVPVMLYFLLDSPRAKENYMSSMETIFYGASPMSPERLREAIELWGSIFYQFYGQSEAPMVLANMKRNEHDLKHPERLGACGRPTPWIHLTLLDDKGEQVPTGESGEICVRGPLVMKEYKDMPEQTNEVFSGGWLHTGDVGRLDQDGFLYIVDRTKDMIVTGGFNVFPREIEDVLSGHDSVSQAIVVGVPDEKWGEAVKAVIVLKPDLSPNETMTSELQELVKKAKGSVHAPKSIDYEESLPMTPVGKPDKKAVRARYWNETDRGVS